MVAKVAITRFRGDTDPFVFNLTKDGSPVNLTGSTFKLSVSTQQSPETPSYTFQIDGVVSSPCPGRVTFTPTLPDVDIVGSFYYDIQMTTGTIVKTIVTGGLQMVQDITK